MKKQLVDMLSEMMSEVFGETEVVRHNLIEHSVIEFMDCKIYISFRNEITFGLRHDRITTENLTFKGLIKQLKVIY